MLRLTFLFACFALLLPAIVLDRIAIVVDDQIITETQLDEEIRVTAFLNGEPIKRDSDTRRAAADRLVEQQLVRREMNLSQYPEADQQELDTLVAATRNQFSSLKEFDDAIKRYEINEDILRRHVGFQAMLLRFLDFRFRPDVEITDQDVAHRYEAEVQKWRRTQSAPPPSLDSMRKTIEDRISAERVDYALASWLEETRKQVAIRYLDGELQ
jgi:hypothetical protein